MQHRLLISTCIFKRTSQYMHSYHWRATVTPCKPGSPLFLPPPWRNVMQWFPNPLTLTPCLPLLPPSSPPPPSASARFEVISYSSLSSRSFKTCSTHSLHVAASVKFPEFLVHSAHMRCRYPTQCPPKCWGKHLQSWSLCCVLFSLHGLPRREGMDIAALPRSALTPLSLRPSHFFPSLTEHSKLSWSQLVSVLHWTI